MASIMRSMPRLFSVFFFSLAYFILASDADQDVLVDPLRYKEACPDYLGYSKRIHSPLSEGTLKLPFQRPSKHCRTFTSPLVEKVIDDLSAKIVDKDIARIFENAFPNTLDTTVRWHVDSTPKQKTTGDHRGVWEGAQSFIVTGDINAEWLRDSTNQLAQYQVLAKKDQAIQNLLLGAIATQAEYVIKFPYCNAFQPPAPSKLQPAGNGQTDAVHPNYEPNFVFECKYELDSLSHFLSLATQYYEHSKKHNFLTERWYKALDMVLQVIEEQSKGTFDENGRFVGNEYRFQRNTNTGTETLSLKGLGNPLNSGTGLVRSAFRPSDDATIFGFLIPANAQMAVELMRVSKMLQEVGGKPKLVEELSALGDRIRKGVWEHGVVEHKTYGKVFAFEVDGYGSHILMDDANIPSLLALPLLGFVARDDPTYQNTRKMILSKAGNPYFLQGREFHGIGGPHVGLEFAWPMSLLVQAMTSDNDEEITKNLELVKQASPLGLIHESINVKFNRDYTRKWRLTDGITLD